MKSIINRRSFTKRSALATTAAATSGMWASCTGTAFGQTEEPHFFLQVVFQGGLDSTYTFDARPLSMTAAKEQTNYLEEEPTKWTDGHGGQALVTRLVEPLKPMRDVISVVNGVVMAANFDGHDQNTNFLLTGNPFGGEAIMPHLNNGQAPLDYVQSGFLFASITNSGASLPLQPSTATMLKQRLATMPGVSPEGSLYQHLMSRYNAVGQMPGRMGAGARALAGGLNHAPQVDGIIRSMEDVNDQEDPAQAQATMFANLFRSGLARSGLLSISPQAGPLDMHSQNSAMAAEDSIGECMQQLATIITTMRDTAYDSQRSLLDVTTIVATTEFSRTMRQSYMEFENSGTDHNPLTNTVVLAGKGIRTGRIVGASDRQQPGEKVSAAHQGLDRDNVKIMGRPFDHASGKVVSAMPEEYDPAQYLTFPNIANGLYRSFGKERGWSLERNGPPAPIAEILFT